MTTLVAATTTVMAPTTVEVGPDEPAADAEMVRGSVTGS